VIAKSFARIHRQNLANFGILPLQLVEAAAYEKLSQGDELLIPDVAAGLKQGGTFRMKNQTTGESCAVTHDLSAREIEAILAGGLINTVRTSDNNPKSAHAMETDQ
jgi:aconitate hydratase